MAAWPMASTTSADNLKDANVYRWMSDLLFTSGWPACRKIASSSRRVATQQHVGWPGLRKTRRRTLRWPDTRRWPNARSNEQKQDCEENERPGQFWH